MILSQRDEGEGRDTGSGGGAELRAVRRRRSCLVYGLLLLATTILACSIYWWGYCGILRKPTVRQPPIRADELFLDPRVFSENWQGNSAPRSAKEDYPTAEEAREFAVWSPRDVVIADQIILHYRDSQEASGAFAEIHRAKFRLDNTVRWESLDTQIYENRVADEFAAVVLHLPGSDVYLLVARYDEFISIFNLSMPPAYMDDREIATILEAIDARMSEHLHKAIREVPLPTVTPIPTRPN